MRKMILGGAVLAAFVAGPVNAQTGGKLTISGTSTVRSWTCTTEEFESSVRPGSNLEGVLRGEKVVSSVMLRFPVAEIGCGNGTMEGHLRKALKADRFSDVTYELSTYELSAASNGVAVQTMGKLTIAGATNAIEMALTVSRGENGQLRVKGETPLTMSMFGVKPPSLMMGTMKVGDAIRVSFDVPLRSDVARVVMAEKN